MLVFGFLPLVGMPCMMVCFQGAAYKQNNKNPMSHPTQAIFLSYASQDADAVKCICEALRATGLDVWFDQSELRGGDAWDASIRKQIKECTLFVPMISAATNARSEGYFRLEWKLAVDRSKLPVAGQSSNPSRSQLASITLRCRRMSITVLQT